MSENTCRLHTGLLTLTLCAEQGGLYVKELCHQNGAGQAFTPESGALLRLQTLRGDTLKDFVLAGIESFETGAAQLFSATYTGHGLTLRLCALTGRGGAVSLVAQAAQQREHTPLFAHSPFLAALQPPGENGVKHYPANPQPLPDGGSILRPYGLFRLPYVLADAQDEAGYCVQFPTLSELAPAVQNRNVDLWGLAGEKALQSHSLQLRLNEVLADIFELRITGLTDGWRQAFCETRTDFLQTLDLSEYARKDLHWMNKAFLHHFTYLFGNEAFDYETGKPDMLRLLAQGEEFGGYDTITPWHQYPRLGIDERSQWDFFDDYPGGLQGLRKDVNDAHAAGVKVLLPYKPWDIGPGECMAGVSGQVAALVKDTGADGLFLDTMDTLPPGFREAVDEVKPGVVFCAEVHPATKNALGQLTSSWGKLGNRPPLKEMDMLRFAFPAHAAPVASRWGIGEQKDALIRRAMLNGTGLVVWQDVFGAWLPFTPRQKETIRRYKQIWLDNHAIFTGNKSIPLFPTLHPALFCNQFAAEEDGRCIFVVYNAGEKDFDGKALQHRRKNGPAVTTLWGGPVQERDGVLCMEIPAGELAMVRSEG